MDTKAPSKEVSRELTRESLIAISQSLPDQALASKVSFGNLNGENVVEVEDGGRAESYRSKLISISYTDSPDTKTLPATVGNLKVRCSFGRKYKDRNTQVAELNQMTKRKELLKEMNLAQLVIGFVLLQVGPDEGSPSS